MVLMVFFLFCHQTIRVTVLLDFATISSYWNCYVNVFFLYCHQTIIFTVLLEFETISSCWTWYGNVFFLYCHQTIKSCRVIRNWNNIKLLDLVWYWCFFFLFCHQTIRVTVLLDFATISSYWNCYVNVFFPLLSPNYHSHRVIRFWNNIKLLDLVWYWYFLSFIVTKLSESPCY